MVLVPQRLEHPVGEAEGQEVLHRLLAEVVVDAVDLLLAPVAPAAARLSSMRGSRSCPNGFSTMSASSPALPEARQQRSSSSDDGEAIRRGGQVKAAVPPGLMILLHLAHLTGKALIGGRAIEKAPDR